MSRVVITPIKVSEFNKLSEAVSTASLGTPVDAVEGAEVLWNFKDERAIIMLQNSSGDAKTITFKAGDSLQGTLDETVTLAGNSTAIFCPESGRFKHFDPKANENKIIIIGEDATIKVAVFVGA